MSKLHNSKLKQQIVGSTLDKTESDDEPSTLIIYDHNKVVKDSSVNLDDRTLLQYFSQGETRLLASTNFQIDSQLGTVKLTLKRNGELIAILKLSENTYPTFIKQECKYREIIHQILLENKFIALGESIDQKGFLEYQKYEIPKGYQLNYTEAINLWKTWWPTKRGKANFQIHLDLLIFTRNNWYPIQQMIGNDGRFYIKTLVGEVNLASTDRIVWLKKVKLDSNSSFIGNSPMSGNKTGKITELVWQNNEDEQVQKYSLSSSDTGRESVELDNHFKNLKNKAIKVLESYLANGEIETQTEIIKDPKGEIISAKVVTIKKPCPQWVIEHILRHD